MLEICDHEFEFRLVRVAYIFLQTNSTTWYRKRKGVNLNFISIMVKSNCHRVVKQKKKQDRGMQGSYYNDRLLYLFKLNTAMPKRH